MEIGLKFETELMVTEELLASNVGSGEVCVFATPMMIANMEKTSALCVCNLIGEGNVTVGYDLCVKHLSATPKGMKVKFVSEITEITSKMITFKVEAFDEVDKIGEGTHVRAIVNKEKFENRTNAKK